MSRLKESGSRCSSLLESAAPHSVMSSRTCIALVLCLQNVRAFFSAAEMSWRPDQGNWETSLLEIQFCKLCLVFHWSLATVHIGGGEWIDYIGSKYSFHLIFPVIFSYACQPLPLCNVHCTMYTVHYTLYHVKCTMYTVQYTLKTVHCTMYTIQCALYNVHCTIYTVQFTLYNACYTMYTADCSLHNVHCVLGSV